MQAQLARRVHPSERDDDLLQGQRLLFVQARGLTKGVDSESTNLKVRPSSSQVLDLTRPSSDVRIDVRLSSGRRRGKMQFRTRGEMQFRTRFPPFFPLFTL